MTPFTKSLFKEPSLTSCSTIAPAKYQLLKAFWIEGSSHAKTTPPLTLSPQFSFERLKFEDFYKHGLYAQNQLKETHRALMTPRFQLNILNQIVSQGTRRLSSSQWTGTDQEK